MAHDIYQQPRDRVGVERVDVRGGFAGDFAAIFQFPGWELGGRVGEVLADDFIFAVAKFGFGAFQGPSELAVRACLAGVDLRSLGRDEELNGFAGGNGDGIGNVGSRFLRGRFVLV